MKKKNMQDRDLTEEEKKECNKDNKQNRATDEYIETELKQIELQRNGTGSTFTLNEIRAWVFQCMKTKKTVFPILQDTQMQDTWKFSAFAAIDLSCQRCYAIKVEPIFMANAFFLGQCNV